MSEKTHDPRSYIHFFDWVNVVCCLAELDTGRIDAPVFDILVRPFIDGLEGRDLKCVVGPLVVTLRFC